MYSKGGKKSQSKWSPASKALWHVQACGEWDALIPLIDVPVIEASSTQVQQKHTVEFSLWSFWFGMSVNFVWLKKNEVAGSDVEIRVVQNNDRMVASRRPWVREIMEMLKDVVKEHGTEDTWGHPSQSQRAMQLDIWVTQDKHEKKMCK